MKKIIICTLIAIIFSNCEIKLNESNAEPTGYVSNGIRFYDTYVDNMQYRIFLTDQTSSQGGGTSIHVVNLTKDKLEIELLKKQLSK